MLVVSLLLVVTQSVAIASLANGECPDPVAYPDEVCVSDGRANPISVSKSSSQPSSTKRKKQAKPTLVLTASPRVASWNEFHPPVFSIRFSIRNADETYWCPDVHWEWPNGTTSQEEGDCPPYESAPPEDIERKTWPIRRIMIGPGEHTITVSIHKAGRKIASTFVVTTVTGGE